MDILGLGPVVVDIIMRVDSLPKEDGVRLIKEISYNQGGTCGNVVVQSARLSAKTGFITKIADDGIGNDIFAALRQDNVALDGLAVEKGGTSPNCQIYVDDNGRRIMFVNIAGIKPLKDEEVHYELIKETKVFYNDLTYPEICMKGMKIAHENHVATVLNIQTGLCELEARGFSKQNLLEALSDVDVLIPCQEAFEDLAGTTDAEKGRQFLRSYFKGKLVLTRGSKGVVAYDEQDAKYEIPVFEITPVDTTGAGDSFNGSFMYSYYVEKQSFQDALVFSSACAAMTCTKIGARSVPTLEEARAFIKNNQLSEGGKA